MGSHTAQVPRRGSAGVNSCNPETVRLATKKLKTRKPIGEYLKYQARFRHLLNDEAKIAEIQQQVDDDYAALQAKF